MCETLIGTALCLTTATTALRVAGVAECEDVEVEVRVVVGDGGA